MVVTTEVKVDLRKLPPLLQIEIEYGGNKSRVRRICALHFPRFVCQQATGECVDGPLSLGFIEALEATGRKVKVHSSRFFFGGDPISRITEADEEGNEGCYACRL
ncbi:MAG: hypothetical protein HY459_01290 [Parcubacteria group bacterium]|nr:hypothetical protein [Parcubacteria group bacterium]